MALQNRVTPFGVLIATPAKGSLMGNRGILHNEQGELTAKRWTHKSWVTCALTFKDYKRSPKARTPGNYTELFFLDEATALAAGHRPCRHCRYKHFIKFMKCWIKGNDMPDDTLVNVIDKQLHAERVTRIREKVTYVAKLSDLPDGVIVVLPNEQATAHIVWGGRLYAWTPEGYREGEAAPAEAQVSVLTPRSTVAALAAGYFPEVALSAVIRGSSTKSEKI